MVRSFKQKPLVNKTGNILHLLSVREITENCLILASPAGRSYPREYRAIIAVDPVNFCLMSWQEQEAILLGFRTLLISQQAHETLNIHVRIKPYDLSPYLEKLQEVRAHAPSPLRELADDHHHFISDLASEHVLLQREFYIRVSVTIATGERRQRLTEAERFERAKQELERRCRDLLATLTRARLAGRRLTTEELVTYYDSCVHLHDALLHPRPASSWSGTDLPLLKEANQTRTLARFEPLPQEQAPASPPPALPTKEEPGKKWTWKPQRKIDRQQQRMEKEQRKGKGPTEPFYEFVSLPELLEPNWIEQTPHYLRISRDTDEYLRARMLIGYPRKLHAGWLDEIIQLNEPYIDLILDIETLDATRYQRRLTAKLTTLRAHLQLDYQHGRVEDPKTVISTEQVERLREKLARQEERAHKVTITLISRASTRQELRERDDKIVALLRQLDLLSIPPTFHHLQAWQSCLPDARNQIKMAPFAKVLDTSSLITAFPFGSSTLSTEPGWMAGVMPNGSLVIINPFSYQLPNGNEVKFAGSGYGKSYDEKVRIGRALLLGVQCIVIDPEDEYHTLARQYEGTSMRLSSGSLQLNPFDLFHHQTTASTLSEKCQSLLVLFDLLLADHTPGMLSQGEKAYLHRSIIRLYEYAGITSDPTTHYHAPPNMRDFYTLLSQEDCGPDLTNLAGRLLRHLDSFPNTTTVALDNRLTVFNIRDLSDELRPVGLFLIADFAWNQVKSEAIPRPRLLSIDEAWTLLQFPEGGRWLSNLVRRARKHNLCVRTITQQVEDFLGTEWGRTIMANSALKFVLRQDPTTIDQVASALHLSPNEQEFLLTCQKGEGLLFAKSSHVAMRVLASPLEHQLATTNPQELLALEQARQDEAEAERRRGRESQEAIGIRQRENEIEVLFPDGIFQQDGTESDTLSKGETSLP